MKSNKGFRNVIKISDNLYQYGDWTIRYQFKQGCPFEIVECNTQDDNITLDLNDMNMIFGMNSFKSNIYLDFQLIQPQANFSILYKSIQHKIICRENFKLVCNTLAMKSVNNYGTFGLMLDGAIDVKHLVFPSSTAVSDCLYVTIKDHMFENSSIETVQNTQHIEYIGKYAFANCKCLKHIDLDVYSTKLAPYAFLNSGVECINIEYFEGLEDMLISSPTAFDGTQCQRFWRNLRNNVRLNKKKLINSGLMKEQTLEKFTAKYHMV